MLKNKKIKKIWEQQKKSYFSIFEEKKPNYEEYKLFLYMDIKSYSFVLFHKNHDWKKKKPSLRSKNR